MFRSAIGVVVLFAGVAAAESRPLPIDGVYGNNWGCADYLSEKGINIEAGPGDLDTMIYVTPERIAGFEYACSIASYTPESGAVSAACEANGGETWPASLSILEDKAARALAYKGEDGQTLTLHRCD